MCQLGARSGSAHMMTKPTATTVTLRPPACRLSMWPPILFLCFIQQLGRLLGRHFTGVKFGEDFIFVHRMGSCVIRLGSCGDTVPLCDLYVFEIVPVLAARLTTMPACGTAIAPCSYLHNYCLADQVRDGFHLFVRNSVWIDVLVFVILVLCFQLDSRR